MLPYPWPLAEFNEQELIDSTVDKNWLRVFLITHQISDAQKLLKVLCHWIMFHCHKHGVEDDAYCDAEVNKWVHDNGIEQLFEPSPAATAVPL